MRGQQQTYMASSKFFAAMAALPWALSSSTVAMGVVFFFQGVEEESAEMVGL